MNLRARLNQSPSYVPQRSKRCKLFTTHGKCQSNCHQAMPQRYYHTLEENQRLTDSTFVQICINISLHTCNGHEPLMLRPAPVLPPSLPNGTSNSSSTSAAPEIKQERHKTPQRYQEKRRIIKVLMKLHTVMAASCTAL